MKTGSKVLFQSTHSKVWHCLIHLLIEMQFDAFWHLSELENMKNGTFAPNGANAPFSMLFSKISNSKTFNFLKYFNNLNYK